MTKHPVHFISSDYLRNVHWRTHAHYSARINSAAYTARALLSGQRKIFIKKPSSFLARGKKEGERRRRLNINPSKPVVYLCRIREDVPMFAWRSSSNGFYQGVVVRPSACIKLLRNSLHEFSNLFHVFYIFASRCRFSTCVRLRAPKISRRHLFCDVCSLLK